MSSVITNTNILLIRHGEKPDSGPLLSASGQARAQAYVAYFQNYSIGAADPAPIKLDYLFAAQDSSASERPYLTLDPLAQALSLTINTDYVDSDSGLTALAKAILEDTQYSNSNILICWHHEKILDLAIALKADAKKLPSKWHGDVYGWVIQLNYGAQAGPPEQTLCQSEKLMYDDHGQDPDALGESDQAAPAP